MKRFEIVLGPGAEADLAEIFDYIAGKASVAVARSYIERIERACLGLDTFPERGTRRDDLRPGLRTIGFERRATILFEVDATRERVVILGVYFAGRSVDPNAF